MLENPNGFSSISMPQLTLLLLSAFLGCEMERKKRKFPSKMNLVKTPHRAYSGRYIINRFFLPSTIQNFPKIFFKKRLVKTPHRAYWGRYIINRFFLPFCFLKTAPSPSLKKPSRGAYIINIFFFHFFGLKNRLYSRRKKLLHLCYHRFARWSNYMLHHSSPEICLESKTMIQFLMQNTSQRCKVQWTSIYFPSAKKS